MRPTDGNTSDDAVPHGIPRFRPSLVPVMVCPAPRFSRRERQLLEGVVDGLSNAQIARILGLQPQTVKNTLTVIYEKVGVRNRLQLAVYALRNRLVSDSKYEGT